MVCFCRQAPSRVPVLLPIQSTFVIPPTVQQSRNRRCALVLTIPNTFEERKQLFDVDVQQQTVMPVIMMSHRNVRTSA